MWAQGEVDVSSETREQVRFGKTMTRGSSASEPSDQELGGTSTGHIRKSLQIKASKSLGCGFVARGLLWDRFLANVMARVITRASGSDAT